MKKPLFDRLLEICRDAGIEAPKNKHIQELLSLSSGRVTQIKNEGIAAAIGESSMAKLVALGYRRDWIKDGILPKFSESGPVKANDSLITQPATSPGRVVASSSVDRYQRIVAALDPLLSRSATIGEADFRNFERALADLVHKALRSDNS